MSAPAIPGSIGFGIGVAGVAVLAGLVLAFVLYKHRERFDPTSDKNLAYSGVNNVGAALTGDKNFSLGVWVWELFHDDADALTTPAPVKAGPNPLGQDPVGPFNVGA